MFETRLAYIVPGKPESYSEILSKNKEKKKQSENNK